MSGYTGFLLWIVSAFLASRVFAVNPTCVFPGSIPACLPNNTMLGGAISVGIGGTLLVVGAVVFDRWERSAKKTGRTATLRRTRLAIAVVALAVALFLAVGVLAFVPSPRHVYGLSDQDLQPTWVTYTTVEGSATIQAYAGDVLYGLATVKWYNRSDGYVGETGPAEWIVHAGDPLSPGNQDVEGYAVLRTGLYTVFALDTVCGLVRCTGNLSQNYTAIFWMNITGTNMTVLPTTQLVVAAGGTGSYVAAVLITWGRQRPPRESA